ncbi:MAG: hypothetical protein MK066_10285, partial [Crocinitomicaceae bacterium]|nr:hypothetical protein [Crocinitomicaceae bacterium]
MKKTILSALSIIALNGVSYSQCPAPEVTPWSDDVETLATTTAFTGQNCWTGAATTAFDWNITSGGTPSFGT